MFALKPLGFVSIFLHSRGVYSTMKAPTFASAAVIAFVTHARFKLPGLSALLAQVGASTNLLALGLTPVPFVAQRWNSQDNFSASATPQLFWFNALLLFLVECLES
jgi:hypothetical protein